MRPTYNLKYLVSLSRRNAPSFYFGIYDQTKEWTHYGTNIQKIFNYQSPETGGRVLSQGRIALSGSHIYLRGDLDFLSQTPTVTTAYTNDVYCCGTPSRIHTLLAEWSAHVNKTSGKEHFEPYVPEFDPMEIADRLKTMDVVEAFQELEPYAAYV